ncbi:Methyltransferase type 11 [Fulvivirga imtechensis AK7]|uniref:Methyltransferase type 11 n=1 Tax=Fulvivirga imtechensis AK7 TaxID=1237149 RepID=L8JSR4_9BACT|nr:methyltransferase domain-containing protein [Fulvivirga imtechensis]ELR72011.1 Methyltransferase type 11 [Fulvivirga imtechensis AK7]
MIEIRHLKLIDAVAKVGSLKKAAEKLFLTQSALSHQLKELETHLGTQVFYRINNQLHFTPAGKEFRDAGKAILEQLGQLENRVQQINQDRLKSYIHGYSSEETQRLNDQASTISELLHRDSKWEDGALILEAGCGVGAQTQIISHKNPGSNFISVDLSEKSLAQASQVIREMNINNVEFQLADVFDLPFNDNTFDHIFVCFLLEHVSKPELALQELKRVLKAEGTITVIEGDHGSTYFYPDSKTARKAIQAQVTLQKQNGGNAYIGRQLYPMLSDAGFSNVAVSPRQVYVDDSKPEMVDRFIKNTFTAMIKGIKDEALSKRIISRDEIEGGIRDLYKTTEGGGTFCYTFFKAIGYKER